MQLYTVGHNWKMSPFVEKAANYALKQHKNQMYAEFPYSYHLEKVYSLTLAYHYVLDDYDKSTVEAAGLLHDVIEDTGVTYNDVQSEFGDDVADTVYGVTNELGKNRKERALKTYPKIAESLNCMFVKFMDRLANMLHSRSNGSDMACKYMAEYPTFRAAFYHLTSDWTEIWEALDKAHAHKEG